MGMDYLLRGLREEDIEYIYHWRNSESIRINMYNDQPIPFDRHVQWFTEVLKSQMDYYRLFIYKNHPLGLVSFKNQEEPHTSIWGVYIGDRNAPKGSGTIMGYLGLDYAFQCLNIKKVIGEVIAFNNKSQRFHEKLGFHLEGVLKDKINRNNEWVDVFRYVLSQEDWEIQKKNLDLNFTSEV